MLLISLNAFYLDALPLIDKRCTINSTEDREEVKKEYLVNTTDLIVTAQAEFMNAALKELARLDSQCVPVQELASNIVVCHTTATQTLMRRASEQRPIFVRHLAPVQQIIPLQNREEDLGHLAMALAQLPTLSLLERGTHFSVQSRFVQTDKSQQPRPFSTGILNRELATALAEETGAVEDIKKPQIVVSLLCTMTHAYIGISPVEENLSDWPGGSRHFANRPEQLSRAEFKLQEALEEFGVTLPDRGKALDLGAAPGGWTRLLLEAGLHVISVDPATLDPRLNKIPHLEHYRGYAAQFIERAIVRHQRFDIIVNDMRMDAREAARLLTMTVDCLHKDGIIISVLKLPHATETIDPLVNLEEALNILRKRFATIVVRQLFHNRQEVTIVAAHPYRRS